MSREQAVFEAAGVGHRITHEGDLPEPKEVLPVVLEHVALGMAQGGGGPSMVAKLTTQPHLQVEGEEAGECPDPTGTIEEGSPDTFVGPTKRPAAVVDDDMVVPCENCSDGPIATGAAHVFVNGRPWARRMDQVDCGALVGEGEPTVLLGGEPSAESRKPQIDIATLGQMKVPGGADVAVTLGHQMAGGGLAQRLEVPQLSGPEIGGHIAQSKHAELIVLLSKQP